MTVPTTGPVPVVKPPILSRHPRLGAGRWNPWKSLVTDFPDWTVSTDERLPGDICGLTTFSEKRIQLCSAISSVQQDCTLAHELVHAERGLAPTDREAANAEERIVDEIAARRLIPIRDVAHELVRAPDMTLSYLAAQLHVDRHTLTVRILTLTPSERRALAVVRGGPLHRPKPPGLWGDPDWDARVEAAVLRGNAARRCATIPAEAVQQ